MPRSAGRLPHRPLIVGIALAGALGLTGWGVRAAMEGRALQEDLDAFRTDLAIHRAEANACQVALAEEEAAFHEYDERVDSLRGEVRGFEALDDRGVPGQRYGEYLEAYDEYNASVPDWQERADSLQALWEACQEAVHRHNALADSLRRWLEALDMSGP